MPLLFAYGKTSFLMTWLNYLCFEYSDHTLTFAGPRGRRWIDLLQKDALCILNVLTVVNVKTLRQNDWSCTASRVLKMYAVDMLFLLVSSHRKYIFEVFAFLAPCVFIN